MNDHSVFFRVDDAWDFATPPSLPTVDVRDEAKGLRFISTPNKIDAFTKKYASQFKPFTLFGSGDFHHLSAIWTRQFTEPFTLVSFDNHPDWDIRPPQWSCGAWINRALELPALNRGSVWGLGDFECWWPGQIFGNRRAERSGQLEVHPWADDRSEQERERRGAILQT